MLCCTLSTSLLTILFTLVRTMLLTIDELTRPEHVVGTAQINLVTMLLTVDKSTRREHVVGTAQISLITVLFTVDKSTRREQRCWNSSNQPDIIPVFNVNNSEQYCFKNPFGGFFSGGRINLAHKFFFLLSIIGK